MLFAVPVVRYAASSSVRCSVMFSTCSMRRVNARPAKFPCGVGVATVGECGCHAKFCRNPYTRPTVAKRSDGATRDTQRLTSFDYLLRTRQRLHSTDYRPPAARVVRCVRYPRPLPPVGPVLDTVVFDGHS